MGNLTEGLNVNDCYTLGYTDDIAIPNSKKSLKAISQLLQNLGMVQQWCDRIQLSYQSTIDGNSSLYKEEGFKGPEGANPLWTHTAADYQGQMPLMYSIQGTDVESTAE